MTANELADKLDMVRIGLTLEAATMLRQQQAEIEALKLRELTDEEINQIVNEKFETWNTKESIIEFARAILKKASEK